MKLSMIIKHQRLMNS